MLKFFINPAVRAYLRELSTQFNGSTNAVRVELNRLVKAKLLKCEQEGRNKYYSADISHPLYPEIHTICTKITGINHIHKLISKLGEVQWAYVAGDYAHGIDGGTIELVLVGRLDEQQVAKMVEQAEQIIARKIQVQCLTPEDFQQKYSRKNFDALLLVWGREEVS